MQNGTVCKITANRVSTVFHREAFDQMQIYCEVMIEIASHTRVCSNIKLISHLTVNPSISAQKTSMGLGSGISSELWSSSQRSVNYTVENETFAKNKRGRFKEQIYKLLVYHDARNERLKDWARFASIEHYPVRNRLFLAGSHRESQLLSELEKKKPCVFWRQPILIPNSHAASRMYRWTAMLARTDPGSAAAATTTATVKATTESAPSATPAATAAVTTATATPTTISWHVRLLSSGRTLAYLWESDPRVIECRRDECERRSRGGRKSAILSAAAIAAIAAAAAAAAASRCIVKRRA